MGRPGILRGPNWKARKLVFGVGVNDAPYPTKTRNRREDTKWTCPYWERWHSMFRRCYSENALKRNPTYQGTIVCDEWIYFMAFREWMETKEWEGKDLDKDFLSKGNKVYSPETCVFIDKRTNCALSNCTRGCGNRWPLGVTRRPKGNKVNIFTASVQKFGTSKYDKYLGDFYTPEEAHAAWQKGKSEVLLSLMGVNSDKRVLQRLKEKSDQLLYDLENNIETTDLSW